MIFKMLQKKDFKKTKEQSKGFTLAELLVAMAVFSLIILIAGAIFVQSVRSGRIITGQAAAFDNVALAIEQMAREIRTGVRFPQAEEVDRGGRSYPELKFTNYHGHKVAYRLINNILFKGTWEPDFDGVGITSSSVKITRLNFYIMGDSDKLPPRITVVIEAEGPFETPLNLQTTVGARLIYYRPMKL